jgi:hypothetical protein
VAPPLTTDIDLANAILERLEETLRMAASILL